MKKLDTIQELIWERSSDVDLPSPPNKDDVWMRLFQHMDISDIDSDASQDQQQKLTPPTQGIWSALKPRLTYAVALGLALVVSLPFAIDSLTTETFETQYSDFQTIQLADGSVVSLNAGSELKYKNGFNQEHRTVTFSGEAYFDVQKGDTPFTIQTDFGSVTVLGTSFNVRSRRDGFEVGVNEGLVQVKQAAETILLKQGELAVLNQNESLTKKPVSYANYPGWMHNQLVCKNTPLSEVCAEIERSFGIDFNFSDPALTEITVTGIIETSDLNNVLSTISILTQHEFKFDGDTCTII